MRPLRQFVADDDHVFLAIVRVMESWYCTCGSAVCSVLLVCVRTGLRTLRDLWARPSLMTMCVPSTRV